VASVTKSKGKFSVKVYAGDAKTLLAFNLDKPSAKNLAGVTIQGQSDAQTAYYIQNELQFNSPGFTDLTEKDALPALDFLRSHILDGDRILARQRCNGWQAALESAFERRGCLHLWPQLHRRLSWHP